MPKGTMSIAASDANEDNPIQHMITATHAESSSLKAEYNLRYVWLISAAAAMGGLLFGWDWVVIGGVQAVLPMLFSTHR